MIKLVHVYAPHRQRTYSYKTLAGARTKASSLVGRRPIIDPDDYAVSRADGSCLFVIGAQLSDLFEETK